MLKLENAASSSKSNLSYVTMNATTRCRTCLAECNEIKSMYTIWNDSTSFWSMYISVMNVGEYVAADFLPHICNKCEENLKSAYSFKLMCTATEKTLNDLYTNSTEMTLLKNDIETVSEYHFDDVCTADISEVDTTEDNQNFDEICTSHADECSNNDSQNETIVEGKSDIQLTEHKIRGRKCKLCGLLFNDIKAYQSHYRQFHPVSKVVCSFCGKLVAKHSIDKHLNSHSSNKNKNHLCTVCGNSFTLIENLKKHLRIHSNDKRYTCDICGEKFIHWNSKRSHVRAQHTHEKKYECNICEKKFAQSSNLFRHIRQHTNDLRHSCNSCSKRFQTKTELNNHIVVHTKEKNEICFQCFKCFGTRKALQAHSKIHTGERNYICTVCNKTFTQPHVLRTHLKTHPEAEIPPRGIILSQKALNRVSKCAISEKTFDGS